MAELEELMLIPRLLVCGLDRDILHLSQMLLSWLPQLEDLLNAVDISVAPAELESRSRAEMFTNLGLTES